MFNSKKKKEDKIDQEPFEVLVDKPLEDGEKDRFGHREISNSLLKIIKKSPRPFNIGVYGQWGVGKSTICKLVQNELEQDDDYKVIYFDTWKYERDSFRRQFLITLDEELELELHYKERLNQSLSVPVNLKWREKLKLVFGDLLFKSLSILVIIVLTLLIFRQSILPLIMSSDYLELSERIVDFGVIGALISFILNSIKQFTTTKTVHRTDSAEGFEDHFTKILDKVKTKNLVVIIDNLDRLSSKNAVGLLGDIKTFLSNEKYGLDKHKVRNKTLFIVPCDNKAINDQLVKQYGKRFDSEEYLRKFFNHSIQIPKFLDIELDDFIVEKLNDTKIEVFENNLELAFVLNYAFRNNPREIIQFVNSLISLYLLARERGISRVIEKDRIAFLAKVLVVRVKWPKLYSVIEDRILRTSDKLDEISSQLDDSSESKELTTFLESTPHINDKEYEDIYFSLRQSPAQKAIPEWGSFVISLQDGRSKDVERIYLDTKPEKLIELSKLLGYYCRRNKRNENLLFNIFLTFHPIVKTEDLKYFQNVFLLAFQEINIQKFADSIDNLKYSSIFADGLKDISPSNKKEFSRHLVSLIERLTAIDNIEREKVSSIKEAFEIASSDKNKDNFSFLLSKLSQAKKQFFKQLKYQELFPEVEKAEKFRKDILDDILDILTSLGPISSIHYAVGLDLFGNLLQWAPITEDDEIRFSTLERSLDFLSKSTPPRPADDTLGQTLSTFTTRISTWYQANKTTEERALCIKIFQKIDLDINPNKEPKSSIRAYISDINNKPNVIIDVLGKDFLTKDGIGRDALINRSGNSLDLLNELPMKTRLTKGEKSTIFNSLLGKEEEALSFLEYVNYSIPSENNGNQNFLKNIVLRMINASSFSDTGLLRRWLDAIGKLGVQSDQVDPFVQKLRQTRTLSDEHKQVVLDFVSKNSREFGDLVVKEFQE